MKLLNALFPGKTPTAGHSARTWLTTASFWSYMAVSNPVLFGGALAVYAATTPFDRRRTLLHRYTSFWAYHYVGALPLWRCQFDGVENIKKDRTYVLVANHQSLGDILVLFGLFRHFKWISKAEIFRVPFIGWNMYLNDYVRLQRGDSKSVEEMLQACRSHLQAGSSIMMFPEGSRSKDGELKPFKRGAFALAKELDVEVVPIVVDGTRDALPKHGLMLTQEQALQMAVRVLPPVRPQDFDSVQALSDAVRGQMLEVLTAMRAEGSGQVSGPEAEVPPPQPNGHSRPGRV